MTMMVMSINLKKKKNQHKHAPNASFMQQPLDSVPKLKPTLLKPIFANYQFSPVHCSITMSYKIFVLIL